MAGAAREVVHLVSPTGDVLAVTPGDAQAAVQAGYALASPEQVKDYELQRKYGSAGQQLLTGAEQAGSALTFGLSTAAERLAGVPAEDISGREEANPLASGLGTAAGVALPFAVTGGTSAMAGGAEGALRAGAEMSAPALISDAGQAVSKVVASKLPQATGTLGKMAAKAISTGAGSAVEGAFFGAGHVVHEAALGDPNLTAQSALSEIGLSAALGGGLGFGLGAMEAGVPVAVSKARDAINASFGKAEGTLGGVYTKAASLVSGQPVEKISELVRRRAELLTAPADAEKFAGEFGGAIGDQYKAMESALRQANREIRPVEREQLAAGINAAEAKREYIRLMDEFQKVRDAMLAKPELYPPMYPAKLDQFRAAMWRDYSADIAPHQVYEQLNELKQNLDPLAKFGRNVTPEHGDAIAAVKTLRAHIKNSLEDEEIWGAAGARQASFNEAQNELLTARKDFQKYFMQKIQTKTGAADYRMNPVKAGGFVRKLEGPAGELPAEALDRYVAASRKMLDEIDKSNAVAQVKTFDREALLDVVNKSSELSAEAKRQASLAALTKQLAPKGGGGMLNAAGELGLGHAALGGAGVVLAGIHRGLIAAKNIPRSVMILAKLERGLQSVSAKMDGLASTIVRGGVKATGIGRGEVAAGLARSFGHDAATAAALFERRSAEVGRLAGDPDQMQEALEAQTKEIGEHAPNTSQAMAVASARGMAFLAAKMPRTPKMGPLAPDLKPSLAEIAKWNRYYEAVNRPMSAMKQMAAGTLTPETVEAVRTVYPELYGKMQAALTDKMAAHPYGIPHQSRTMMGMFMGRDLDGSGSSHMFGSNQRTWAGPSMSAGQGAPPKRTSLGGLSSITIGSRLLTPAQAASQRR